MAIEIKCSLSVNVHVKLNPFRLTEKTCELGSPPSYAAWWNVITFGRLLRTAKKKRRGYRSLHALGLMPSVIASSILHNDLPSPSPSPTPTLLLPPPLPTSLWNLLDPRRFLKSSHIHRRHLGIKMIFTCFACYEGHLENNWLNDCVLN